MEIYKNKDNFAVVHNGSLLLLIGPSLYGPESERKIFYNRNALNHYLSEHGYRKIN